MKIQDPKMLDDLIIESQHLATSAKEAVLASKYHAFPVSLASISAGSGSSVDVTDKVFTAATNKKTGGSGSVRGVVTDTPNNKVEIKDQSTDGHITDGSDRQVYGRNTKTDSGLTNSITVDGTTAVTGVDTIFQSELSSSDYIKLDSDGTVRKVASIESDTALTLVSAYPSSGSGVGSKVTLTLGFYVGDDTGHSMSAETINILSPESIDLQAVPFNAFMAGAAFAEALPAEHAHDDTYYTETELDGGQLDDQYYTETELDGGQLDSRYFTETEHINTSAGAGDSGKPIKLDSSGLINDNMISGTIKDHGSMDGLGDDDHTDYHTDARGDARYFTETEMGEPTGTTGGDLVGIDAASIIGSSATEVQTTLESIARKRRNEVVTVTSTNTINDLTYTPREPESVVLVVNAVPQIYTTDYTISGKEITWVSGDFDLETTDTVQAIYDSSD